MQDIARSSSKIDSPSIDQIASPSVEKIDFSSVDQIDPEVLGRIGDSTDSEGSVSKADLLQVKRQKDKRTKTIQYNTIQKN